MEINYVKLSDIATYPNNAKLYPREQIEQIKESIQEFGFNDPLALDENNVIIEGHGRYLAARELGMDELPCITLEGLTDEQKKAYILVHNKLTMSTGFDLDVLASELKDIEEIDMGDFGFAGGCAGIDIDSFFEQIDTEQPKADKEPKTVKCPHCGEVFELD